MAHHMLLGFPPFGIHTSDDHGTTLHKTLEAELALDTNEGRQLSGHATDFLLFLLQRDPQLRMTIRGSFRHSFVAQHAVIFDRWYRKQVMAGWTDNVTIIKSLDSVPELARLSGDTCADQDLRRECDEHVSHAHNVRGMDRSSRVQAAGTKAPPNRVMDRKRPRLIEPC